METAPSSDAHRSFCNLLESTERDGHVGEGSDLQGSPHNLSLSTPDEATVAVSDDHPVSSHEAFDAAVARVRSGVVGRHKRFRTPYSDSMPIVYADWTATGRAVHQIEGYIADEVLPLFGNTHTTTSITGAQTTCFRHEARQIIAEAVNAKAGTRVCVVNLTVRAATQGWRRRNGKRPTCCGVHPPP